ncbi:pyridoxal-phosphate dependent enzyme [Roseivivax isoporae]|uniref:Diaminopropionate ammonia-lyase n=1 Tax=Roseivivax isoporae LMG 25204 TaxID=1449351 RepID=X7F8K4_9RHOB|nr:pyridoxal-phosphate dependent enzyme [Roseivivax isoporae]ETX29125.1 diaminopropionate ammonia-lyase [Roseivivax isoporae LMG 25204]
MQILDNPHRSRGIDHPDLAAMPWPSADAAAPRALLARCPAHAPTPLAEARALAAEAGIAALHVKDERGRMGLGSFKALGAASVIAVDAERGRARGATYVTASAGNHGLSVAAGARAFGARARIFLSRAVPSAFADRLAAEGAEVVRAGADYAESMQEAEDAARRDGHVLLSDSSWPGYADLPHLLMQGYLVLTDEAAAQLPAPPTHVFVQAGVGGLAAAVAAHARALWGDTPRIVVVEPEAAPALAASIAAGAPVTAPGPVSAMGRLDCKTPSLVALKGLARDACAFATITEDEAATAVARAAAHGLASTPSGAAGLAGLLAAGADLRDRLGLDASSRVLAFLTERPE